MIENFGQFLGVLFLAFPLVLFSFIIGLYGINEIFSGFK